jgi:hypothetical protein
MMSTIGVCVCVCVCVYNNFIFLILIHSWFRTRILLNQIIFDITFIFFNIYTSICYVLISVYACMKLLLTENS